MLVVRDEPDDRGPRARVGPQTLALAPGVGRDHRVRGREDVLGRAVVLLEQDRARVRVVGLELHDVADRRPAERVDRLVRVAHDGQLAGPDRARAHLLERRDARELAHEHVLGVVRVLVLVDQHVPEPSPVALRDHREALQQLDGRHDQVVEVERVRLPQPRLVAGVPLREHRVERVGRAGRRPGLARERLRVDQLVLERGDLRDQHLGRVPLGVQIELARDHGHQLERVRGVVDREARAQRERRGLFAQDPHARRVERRDPHRLGGRADQRLDPFTHLRGCLVRERDREDLTGPGPVRGEQVRDPVGQHARLARTCARDDQQRAARVQHRLALLRVETDEQALRVAHRPGARLAFARPARRRAVRGRGRGRATLRPGARDTGYDRRLVCVGRGESRGVRGPEVAAAESGQGEVGEE